MSKPFASISEEDRQQILKQNESLWPKFKNKRLFMTGGTGFFGKWLSQALIAANREFDLNLETVILVRDPQRAKAMQPWLNERGISLVKGDVRSMPRLEEHFDYIVHAAFPSGGEEVLTPEQVKAVIVDGTKGALDLAKRSEDPRFLFVSSGAVYGEQPPSITNVTEDFDGTPNTPYGEAKKISEQDCQQAKGIELSIARCYAFVGPYLPLDTHFAAGNFMRNILQNETITLQGDGMPYRSYMYPTDLVHWLLKILVESAPGAVYNVGSDEEVKLRDLAVMLNGMREELGLSPGNIKIMKEPDVAAPRNAYVPSTKKAQSELKLHLTVPLQEAFRKTLQWHKEV